MTFTVTERSTGEYEFTVTGVSRERAGELLLAMSGLGEKAEAKEFDRAALRSAVRLMLDWARNGRELTSIHCIKIVRTLTGWSLYDAKALVDEARAE